MYKALFRAFGFPFMLSGIYKIINDGLVFVGPLLLNRIVQFVQDPSEEMYLGELSYTSIVNNERMDEWMNH